ncbi:KRAB domain-containing zinc finger protein [Sarotherodon galilaeus]
MILWWTSYCSLQNLSGSFSASPWRFSSDSGESKREQMGTPRTLVLLFLIGGFSSSQTSGCSYYGLLEYLNLTGSDSALQIMRPVKDWNTATLIQLDMYLLGILEVDEKSQTVMVHIVVNMAWTNEFLTWNLSDFCGIDNLSVPGSLLWAPDVRIGEDVSDTGSVQKGPLVTVYSSGLVFSSEQHRLTYTCRLSLRMFPFDTQSCNITFSSMTSNVKSIRLETFSSDEVLGKISEVGMVTKGEWELDSLETINYTSAVHINKSKLLYTVIMVRKPLLYVINLIIPLFYFLVLDLASFLINEAKGEKLSFKVTLLLSISVLLLILKDMLPSTEKHLPMIAKYCVGIFTLVGVSVLETMLVIFLMDLDGYCSKKTQDTEKSQVDIQLEANYHEEPMEVDERGHEKPAKSFLMSDCDLLKLILDELGHSGGESPRHVATVPPSWEELRRAPNERTSVF